MVQMLFCRVILSVTIDLGSLLSMEQFLCSTNGCFDYQPSIGREGHLRKNFQNKCTMRSKYFLFFFINYFLYSEPIVRTGRKRVIFNQFNT